MAEPATPRPDIEPLPPEPPTDASAPPRAARLYREEAVDAFHRGHGTEGEVLRLSPAWLGWVYWLVVAAFLSALVVLVFGKVNLYASGPVVLRAHGLQPITATQPGTVLQLLVLPGDPVEAGQPLVKLDASGPAAGLASLDREFELQLMKTLRDPEDAESRRSLAALSGRRDEARLLLEDRTLRAPRAGRVAELRVREGQRLEGGDVAVVLAGEQTRFSAVALLPGEQRPLLGAGMSLRMELAGFQHRYHSLRLAQVGESVVGPQEVRRIIGAEVADALELRGPVVLATAHLDDATFEVDGIALRFHEGMIGRAEVPTRRERIAFVMFPWIREFFSDAR